MDTPYEKLLVGLARADVKFIVVGGVAVALNGFLRTTEDVAILIERSPGNVGQLLAALASFGEGHARELSWADFEETEGAIRVVEDFPLDIFTIMRAIVMLTSSMASSRRKSAELPSNFSTRTL